MEEILKKFDEANLSFVTDIKNAENDDNMIRLIKSYKNFIHDFFFVSLPKIKLDKEKSKNLEEASLLDIHAKILAKLKTISIFFNVLIDNTSSAKKSITEVVNKINKINNLLTKYS